MSGHHKQKRILYITFPLPKTKEVVFSFPSLTTAKALQKAGFNVTIYHSDGIRKTFIRELFILVQTLSAIDIIYITCDGGTVLEKFTLLKLFKPSLVVIWEIHGPVEEHFWDNKRWKNRVTVFRRNIKRRMLSFFASSSICLTEPLRQYSIKYLGIKKCTVIPSYVDSNLARFATLKTTTRDQLLFWPYKNLKKCIVFWHGSAYSRWHNLDQIEKVAKLIYKKNPSIIFVLVGSCWWHHFRFTKNIILLESMQYSDCMKLASCATIGIALYKTNSLSVTGMPMHFSPRKIVELMALGKPVIASRFKSVETFIKNGHNGVLVEHSINSVVKAILSLSNNQSMRETIGKQAQQTILNKFTIVQAAQLYKKFIQHPL